MSLCPLFFSGTCIGWHSSSYRDDVVYCRRSSSTLNYKKCCMYISYLKKERQNLSYLFTKKNFHFRNDRDELIPDEIHHIKRVLSHIHTESVWEQVIV
jgi:hypothetical protein